MRANLDQSLHERRMHVRQLLQRIEFRSTYFLSAHVDQDSGGIYLQLEVQRPDAYTLEPGFGIVQRTIPWGYTDSQIVRCVFRMLLDYEEHETREAFRFDGKRIFGPHIDITALAEVAGRTE